MNLLPSFLFFCHAAFCSGVLFGLFIVIILCKIPLRVQTGRLIVADNPLTTLIHASVKIARAVTIRTGIAFPTRLVIGHEDLNRFKMFPEGDDMLFENRFEVCPGFFGWLIHPRQPCPPRLELGSLMILELKHPTRGDIGWVELRNGKVVRTGSAAMINQVRQMQGWIENSVRVYAVANNWICTEKTDATNS